MCCYELHGNSEKQNNFFRLFIIYTRIKNYIPDEIQPMIIKFNYHEPFTYSIGNVVTIRVAYSLSVMRGGTQRTENYLLASHFLLKKKKSNIMKKCHLISHQKFTF